MALFFYLLAAVALIVGLLWDIRLDILVCFTRGSLIVRIKTIVFYGLIPLRYERRFLLYGKEPVERVLREHKLLKLLVKYRKDNENKKFKSERVVTRKSVDYTDFSAEGTIGFENDAVSTLVAAGVIQLALETTCAAAGLPPPQIDIHPMFERAGFRIKLEGIVLIHITQIIGAFLTGIFCEKRGRKKYATPH